MNRKKMLALAAMTILFALLCTACGSQEPEAAETKAPVAQSQTAAEEVLGLSDWTLTATTWSSPNGATVNLSATPAGYAEGQSASFVVRLEGEEMENVPCEWDGKAYTASVDLNGADGYCYYVAMTGSNGNTAEIPVNIPTDPIDESLINMASSLESMCSVIVESSDFDGKWLSITSGTVVVQPPKIVNQGERITCSEAVLVLSLNGEETARVALDMPEPNQDGSYSLALADTAFQVPALEDDQQLTIGLDVTLSNGQTLSAEGGTWFYNAGSLMMAVG